MAGLTKTQLQLGDSTTATHNFTLSSAAADGSLKLARGNFGATTQDILIISSNDDITAGSTAVSKFPIAFACERGGGPTAVSQTFAFGNGSAGIGIAMPYAGKVYCMTISTTGQTSGQITTIQMCINGTAQGTNYQVSITGNGSSFQSVTLTFATPLAFSAGTLLNVISTAFPATAPTCTNAMFVVKYD